MNLNNEQTKRLQYLLKEVCGLDIPEEQAQEVGRAVLRFVIAKNLRIQESINNKEK